MSIEVPAEWSPQKAIWTAWPSHPDLWEDNLMPARREVAAMIAALATAGRVNVLAMGDKAIKAAKTALTSPNVHIISANFGDIWLRDTGPIFVRDNGKKAAATFRFNGWGGKYELEHDNEVAGFIAAQSGAPVREHDFILEGGALEHDGAGTILTTRQCLLNQNRHVGGSVDLVVKRLKEAFGAQKVLWLEKGLLNDHTDGHIDNLARFTAPGHVLCQSPSGADDPNAEVLDSIAASLENMHLKVTRIPSPGLITDEEEGTPVAASHMNYIIFNGVIVMPSYEDKYSVAAAAALQNVFPGKRVVVVPARHVLTGGGAFHCITQQEF
jgi:agmatine deiminase